MECKYDQYSITCLSLDAARLKVEGLLNLSFKPHDSSHYKYIYYLACGFDDEEFQLSVNEDFEGEPISNYEERTSAIVLDIGPTERRDELRSIFSAQPN